MIRHEVAERPRFSMPHHHRCVFNTLHEFQRQRNAKHLVALSRSLQWTAEAFGRLLLALALPLTLKRLEAKLAQFTRAILPCVRRSRQGKIHQLSQNKVDLCVGILICQMKSSPDVKRQSNQEAHSAPSNTFYCEDSARNYC